MTPVQKLKEFSVVWSILDINLFWVSKIKLHLIGNIFENDDKNNQFCGKFIAKCSKPLWLIWLRNFPEKTKKMGMFGMEVLWCITPKLVFPMHAYLQDSSLQLA